MTVLAGMNQQLGMIGGVITASGNATGVFGGTLTAGTFDVAGSGLITFAPPFISAPAIFVSYDGFGANTNNIAVAQLTGVTVSNAYVSIGTTPASGGRISFVALGLQRL